MGWKTVNGSWSDGFPEASWSGSKLFPKQDVFLSGLNKALGLGGYGVWFVSALMHVFIKTKIRKNWTAYCNNILFFILFFSSAIDSAKFYEIAAIWCWVTLFLMSAYFYVNNPNKILKKIIFLECHQSVKQFWFRSDQTFSLAWFGSNCLQRLSADNKSQHLLLTELTLCLLMFSVDITFASSLDPDQARQNIGPDLDPVIQTVTLWWYSWKKFS